IERHLDTATFIDFCKDKYPDRKIESCADLTLGEYLGVIGNRELWGHFRVNIDRKVLLNKLDRIRLIRNDVMHFRAEGISNKNMNHLKDVSKFFRILDSKA